MSRLELTPPPSPARLVLAFAAVYIIWGSTYLAIRFALETLPPFLMAGCRFLVAGGLLYGWSRWKGAPAPDRHHWRAAIIVGALLLFGGNGLVVWAEQSVPSSLAALIIATVPLWMTTLDWVTRGERPSTGVMAGVLVGFGGVALLVGQGDVTGTVHPLSALMLVTASFSWSCGSLYSRGARLPSHPLLATGMEMLGGGVLLTVLGLTRGELGTFEPAMLSARSLYALLYLIVFGSLIGFTAYIWLLRVTTPARASTYAYVNPVVAVLLGWALADEPLSVRTLLAAAVIVSAVAVMTGYRSRGAARVPAPPSSSVPGDAGAEASESPAPALPARAVVAHGEP